MLTFVVPGKPSPKARPRVVRLKNGASHTFTPDDHGYVPQIQSIALQAMGGQASPTSEPVVLTLTVNRLMPKSWSNRKRESMRGRLTTTRPDPVNIAMNYCDALTGYCWQDDSLVHLRCEVRWADRDDVCVMIQEEQ